MKKKLLFAVCISVLAFQSCSKNGNEETCQTSIATISGTYKLTSLIYKPASGPESNWFTSGVVQDCKKDDLYILASNGDFNIQDAGTICSTPGDYTGTWTFVGGNIDMDSYYSGTINSFDCKTLVFTQNDALDAGDKLTSTFVKQ